MPKRTQKPPTPRCTAAVFCERALFDKTAQMLSLVGGVMAAQLVLPHFGRYHLSVTANGESIVELTVDVEMLGCRSVRSLGRRRPPARESSDGRQLGLKPRTCRGR